MICDHPLGIGLGYERFSGHYRPYALKGTETVIHTHQILLQIFCELGIFGLLLFLMFLGVFFFESVKQRHCIGQDRKLRCFGGSIAITGALAAGMFDHIWYHHGVFCLFWGMAALAASAFGREKSKKGS
jgi:O-antigen ligase